MEGMTDTWGIPGPTFLLLYIALAAIGLAFGLVRRRQAVAGPREPSTGSLGPAHLAVLADGPQRAIHASLATLNRAGAIEVSETGRLHRIGGVPAGASELDSAVLHAAGGQPRVSELARDRTVAAALAQIQADLVRRGLLVSPQQRASALVGAKVMAAVFALGGLRLVFGVEARKPVLFLALALGLVAVAVFALRRVPRVTRAGSRFLGRMRHDYQHLDRRRRPAWQTADPAMMGMAVGLFGAALLWDADPSLAQHAAIPASVAGSGTGSQFYGGDYGSSGGGDGGGGSCGGGGGGGGGCGG
jgi:uncharacterized protein (TIGR04222 family)